MPKLWRHREGDPTGDLWADITLRDLATLGLSPDDYLCDLSQTPQFDVAPPPKGVRVIIGSPTLRGYRHVVVEVNEAEATPRWKPGRYYNPRITPTEAYERLHLESTTGKSAS
jgi:hypothetical protein